MRFLAFVIVVICLTISCKKSNEDENSICFTRTATQLEVKNNTDKVFYIASFGQNILPLIYWAPGCGTNNVQPRSTIHLELSSIAGYSENDKLVVYWWECANGNAQQINNVILDANQTLCE